jgi:predicted transposase/invertase (TIGR01784 family)
LKNVFESSFEEGFDEGFEKSFEIGKLEEKKEIAQKLLSFGLSIEKVKESTGLSEEDIRKLNF